MSISLSYTKTIKLILKILFSAGAIVFVLSKMDIKLLLKTFSETNFRYIIPALIFFILSKIISSLRLNIYFKRIGINLDERMNFKLYWLGMFYNTILPGGIGGDGYKIWWLHKYWKRIGLKKITAAILIDRISGMVALSVLSGLLSLAIFPQYKMEIAGSIFLLTISYVIISNYFFPYFKKIQLVTFINSVGVQISQIVCAYLIIESLSIQYHIPELILVFLISSVAAALPLSIGGAGAREIVFFYAAQILKIPVEVSVVIALWFFVITFITSLWGLRYTFSLDKIEHV